MAARNVKENSTMSLSGTQVREEELEKKKKNRNVCSRENDGKLP